MSIYDKIAEKIYSSMAQDIRYIVKSIKEEEVEYSISDDIKKVSDLEITKNDRKYLEKIFKEKTLIEVIDKIIGAIAFSSLNAKSYEDLTKREGAIFALNRLKEEFVKSSKPEVNVDYRTGETIE
jgi:hypothetical protein